MSYDKDDSDFEVCLTSSEYNRILSVEKEHKKLKEEYRIAKQDFQKEIEDLKKELTAYDNIFKSKNQEIDGLTVECLRLKKLRLAHEDQISNFKEEHLRMKEQSLSELQSSVRENKQMKEKRISDECRIIELQEELSKYKNQNISLSERMLARVRQIETINLKLEEKSKHLENQLDKGEKRGLFLEKDIQEIQKQLEKSKKKYLSKSQQTERLKITNNQSEIKLKEQLVSQSRIATSLEKQLTVRKEEINELIKQKDNVMAKHNEKTTKLQTYLHEATKKIQTFINQARERQKILHPNKDRFSFRIYQALEQMKDGAFQPKQLKEQIQSILVFEKEYQDIIAKNGDKIRSLELQIKELSTINSDLVFKSSVMQSQLMQFQKKSNDSSMKSQIVILREELDKQKRKLKKMTSEHDETVKTYNLTIQDLQLKQFKDAAEISELQSSKEALKLSRQYQKQQKQEQFREGLQSGIKMFEYELRGFIQPATHSKIMKALNTNLQKIKK